MLINYDNKQIKINARCTRSLVIVIFPQHRGGAASTNKQPRPSTQRRIQRNGHVARPLRQQQHQHATGTTNQPMEVLPFPPTQATGRWVSLGSILRPFSPPSRVLIHPSFTHPQFVCTDLPRLHSQQHAAVIERLATDKNWPGELCPHRRSTPTEQSSVDVVTIYSSD